MAELVELSECELQLHECTACLKGGDGGVKWTGRSGHGASRGKGGGELELSEHLVGVPPMCKGGIAQGGGGESHAEGDLLKSKQGGIIPVGGS